MVESTDSYAINTFFEKPAEQLITFRDDKAPIGPDDWSPTKCTQADFAPSNSRMKNAITNIETDTSTELNSDHSHMITELKSNYEMNENKTRGTRYLLEW